MSRHFRTLSGLNFTALSVTCYCPKCYNEQTANVHISPTFKLVWTAAKDLATAQFTSYLCQPRESTIAGLLYQFTMACSTLAFIAHLSGVEALVYTFIGSHDIHETFLPDAIEPRSHSPLIAVAAAAMFRSSGHDARHQQAITRMAGGLDGSML